MALAYILINVKNGQDSRVAAELVKYQQVDEIHLLYGMYNIIIKVKAKDLNALHDFTDKELSNIKDISTTATLVVADKNREDNRL